MATAVSGAPRSAIEVAACRQQDCEMPVPHNDPSKTDLLTAMDLVLGAFTFCRERRTQLGRRILRQLYLERMS